MGFGAPRVKEPRGGRGLQWIPESWNMALGGLVLGSPIPYLKGMRILMFQLSGFCFKALTPNLPGLPLLRGIFPQSSRIGDRRKEGSTQGPLRLMVKILHYLKDPKLWELRYIPYYGWCRILAINRSMP